MRVPAFVVLSMLALATPAMASSVVPGGQEQAAAPKDKKICRRSGAETGTILGSNRRICHTQDEWAKIDEQQERDTQNALDRRQRNMAPGE